jgi:MFS transporter, OFA family, oxalate/formate antiporter
MPSFNAGCFGTKYMGLNYALILTAWGFAALVGPILVARAKDTSGSFAGMLPLIALLLLGAVILPFLTKKPTRRLTAAESFRPSLYDSLESPTGEFR